MEKKIRDLYGKYVQIRWKEDGKYSRIRTGYIKGSTVSGSFNIGNYHSDLERIKFKDVTEIKLWKKPICPLCKSTEIKDFSKSAMDGPNLLNHIITCCICKECGILFINKNDKDQCLWNE